MQPIEAFKPLGLVSATILFCGLVFVVKKWPLGTHATFSQHIATNKSAIVYYVVLFSISLPLLLLFILGWFVPTFQPSEWFSLFAVTAALAQIICTLIPEVGGWQSKTHRTFAYISGDFLLPTTFMLAITSSVSFEARIIAVMATAIMLGIILLLLYVRLQHNRLLLLQAAYFTSFFVALLSASYLR